MYLSEGGMASSTRAAQFMKALTRIVWRVVGRRTSLRLVQCTKANSGISSTLVLQGFESVILCTALFTRAWRWLMAQGASYAPLLWAKAVVEESPTSWLLPICYDQPLRLQRSINCTTIDEVMQDRSTRQVEPSLRLQFPPWSSASEQLRRDVSASSCLDGISRKRLLEDYHGLRNLRGCKVQRASNSGFFVVVMVYMFGHHAKGPELAGPQAFLACSADR